MSAIASQELLHTPEGVRDLYGKEYAAKRAVTGALHRQMALYGYEDIQTPTFEFFDVFSREIGTTPSRELYKFIDKDGSTLVLRPDFTPSVVRCAARYDRDETAPLRFCYEGSAFVNTSSLQGKLKETTQTGVELMNEGSVEADGEVIALLISALRSAGLEKFQISVGNVEYFKGLCQSLALDSETEELLRAEISGKNYFAAERLLIDRGVGEKERAALLQVTEYIGQEEALRAAGEAAGNARSQAAVERLRGLYEVLRAYRLEKYVSFDLSMLNRYNYYTGVIFKAYTHGVGDAIASGGRYDTLCAHFGKEAAAIGMVIQVDALLEALRRQQIAVATPPAPVEIAYTDETYAQALQKAQALRANGTAAVLRKAVKGR